MCRDSSVGIATRYGLEIPGIESRRGRDFPHQPRGTPSNGYRVSYPEVKRPGRGVDHPPPSSAEIKERVELYIYPLLDLRGLFGGEYDIVEFVSSLSQRRLLVK